MDDSRFSANELQYLARAFVAIICEPTLKWSLALDAKPSSFNLVLLTSTVD